MSLISYYIPTQRVCILPIVFQNQYTYLQAQYIKSNALVYKLVIGSKHYNTDICRKKPFFIKLLIKKFSKTDQSN